MNMHVSTRTCVASASTTLSPSRTVAAAVVVAAGAIFMGKGGPGGEVAGTRSWLHANFRNRCICRGLKLSSAAQKKRMCSSASLSPAW